MSGASEGPWYRRWFGEEYLDLYPHRDEREAARGVRLLDRAADLPTGSRVLDLACGAGRHLSALREAGYAPVGLDLSRPLLHRARRRERPSGGWEARGRGEGTRESPRLVRADMRRLPLSDGSFDGVVLFFTSFGYFADPRDDRRVLEELSRILRPGGVFLLDTFNPAHVRRELVPVDEREVKGRRVRQTRRIAEGRVEKRIEIFPATEGGRDRRVFHERVRLYEPEELESLLGEAGLEPERRFGDYGGEVFVQRESPRLILVGRRP